jgi:hypothetical protein
VVGTTGRTLARGRAPAIPACPQKAAQRRLMPPLATMVQASAV